MHFEASISRQLGLKLTFFYYTHFPILTIQHNLELTPKRSNFTLGLRFIDPRHYLEHIPAYLPMRNIGSILSRTALYYCNKIWPVGIRLDSILLPIFNSCQLTLGFFTRRSLHHQSAAAAKQSALAELPDSKLVFSDLLKLNPNSD